MQALFVSDAPAIIIMLNHCARYTERPGYPPRPGRMVGQSLAVLVYEGSVTLQTLVKKLAEPEVNLLVNTRTPNKVLRGYRTSLSSLSVRL